MSCALACSWTTGESGTAYVQSTDRTLHASAPLVTAVLISYL
ncbi:hypothetical protein ACFV1L_08775 [Kitasatospora sp. NPDC059646]